MINPDIHQRLDFYGLYRNKVFDDSILNPVEFKVKYLKLILDLNLLNNSFIIGTYNKR